MPEINTARLNRNTNMYKPFKSKCSSFSKSFFPYFSKYFNNLDISLSSECDILIFKEKLKIQLKPRKIRHFAFGSKRGNALWTQLRIGRSLLNGNGFEIGLSVSDLCLCLRSESVSHFFNECFIFTEERNELYNSMEQILPKFKTFSNKVKLDILLHGINLQSEETDSRNRLIIFAVQNFILKTKRF